MPKYQPLDLMGGFYTDDALSWSAQDTVNWLPVAAEVNGTRTVTKFRSPPGLLSFSTLPSGPVRNTHDVEGKLFSVSGGSLYQIATNGTPTNRGAIPGVGRVSMAHNQITFGNQLTIVNSDSSGYVWNTVTNTLTKITDPGFEGSVYVDFQDGYMIHTDPFGRWWFLSELADALNFNTFDRYVPEASPDGLVVARAFQGQVVAFNKTTIEFYAPNTSNPTPGDTYQNTKTVINKGCASRDSVARINNTLAWLAEDGAVYILNGYREQKISTVPLEQAFSGLDWSQAFAEVWEDQGHSVYYLTFPDGRTWGYDFTSGLWTRRQSYEMNRWRMNSMTFWNGKWIVGDFQLGQLYELKWGVYHENGNHLISERASGYSHSNQNRVYAPYVELMFDTGVGEVPGITLSGDLPNGFVGDPLTFSYAATGGFAPYVFTLASGSLPAGLTLQPNGSVTGTFTSAGTFNWTIRVTDNFGTSAELPDSSVVGLAKWIAWVSTGGAPGMIESLDGLDWTTLPKRTSASLGFANAPGIVHGISYLGKTIFQTRNPRTEGGNPSTRLALSSDVGATWTDTDSAAVSTVGGINLWGLCSGGGFVFRSAFTGGTAGVWRSPDGETWTYKTIPNPNKTEALAYKGSRLVASNKSRDYLMFSDNNADAWTQGGSAFPGNNNIQDVVANQTNYFACSSGAAGVGRGVRYSANGNTGWAASAITLSSTQEPAKLIVFSETVIVLFCSDTAGSIFTSTDGGLTFSPTGSLGVQVLDAHTDGRLIVCVGSNGGTGSLATSTDGLTWTPRSTNAGTGNTIQAVIRSFGS